MALDAITPEEYATWLTPREALNALKPMGFDAAAEMILDHCRHSQIHAASSLLSFWDNNGQEQKHRFVRVTERHWRELTLLDLIGTHFWDSGTAKVFGESDRELGRRGLNSEQISPEVIALGIRFRSEDVFALASQGRREISLAEAIASGRMKRSQPGPAQQIAPTAPRHAGGRPAWPGWDDLWAEIAVALYNGDLKPTKQKDIEAAMLEIAERTEDGPKIAVIRTKARTLWQALQKDGN